MSHDLNAAAALASALWLFYFIGGHFREAQRLYDALIEQRDRLSDERLAWVLNGRCSVAMAQGEYLVLDEYARQALNGFQDLDDDLGVALAYHHLLASMKLRGDISQASRLVELGLKMTFADRWLYRLFLRHQSDLYAMQGDFENAVQTALRSLEISEQTGDTWTRLYDCVSLAELELRRKNLDRARELLLTAQQDAEMQREFQVSAWTHELLAMAALAVGEPEQAASHFQRSVEIEDEIGSGQGRVAKRVGLGVAHIEAGRFEKATGDLRIAAQLAIRENLLPSTLDLLEQFARLIWLERRDPACVLIFAACSAGRAEHQLPATYPYDVLVNQLLDRVRQEVEAGEFAALWQAGLEREPGQLLQELIQAEGDSGHVPSAA
jgi:tetratricopeptide (TPR) repeat protein